METQDAALDGSTATGTATGTATAAVCSAPSVRSWDDAVRQACLEKSVLAISGRQILNSNPSRIRLPCQESVLQWNGENDTDLAVVVDSLLVAASREGTRKTKTNAVPRESTPETSVEIATAWWTSISTHTSTLMVMPQKAASLLLSPARAMATLVLGETDYGEYADNDAATASKPTPKQLCHPIGTSATPNTSTVAPATATDSATERIGLDDRVVDVDLCRDCIHFLEATLEASAPTVVPVGEFVPWLLRESERYCSSSDRYSSGGDVLISSLVAKLPRKHLNLLVQVLLKFSAGSLQLHQSDTNEADSYYIVGNDPRHPVDVRCTLYQLDSALSSTQTTLDRYHNLCARATATARSSLSNKADALRALKQRKLFHQHAEHAQGRMWNLLQAREAIEQATDQRNTIQTLQAAARTLKTIRMEQSSKDGKNSDTLYDDLRDELDHVEEVAATVAASSVTTDANDDELLQELERMVLDDSVGLTEQNAAIRSHGDASNATESTPVLPVAPKGTLPALQSPSPQLLSRTPS